MLTPRAFGQAPELTQPRAGLHRKGRSGRAAAAGATLPPPAAQSEIIVAPVRSRCPQRLESSERRANGGCPPTHYLIVVSPAQRFVAIAHPFSSSAYAAGWMAWRQGQKRGGPRSVRQGSDGRQSSDAPAAAPAASAALAITACTHAITDRFPSDNACDFTTAG